MTTSDACGYALAEAGEQDLSVGHVDASNASDMAIASAFGGQSPAETNDEWPTPQPVPAGLPSVDSFEYSMLPESLQAWCQDIAERMYCPPEYVAIPAIVLLSSVVGRQVGIRPKAVDEWTVVPNLWGAIVGRPGTLKTPAANEALRLIKPLEKDARSAYDKAVEESEVARMVADAEKKVGLEQILKSVRKQEDVDEAARRVLQRSEVSTPTRRRYMTSDVTIEKLGELLRDNPNGILIMRDELAGLFKSMDRDGREGERAFFLEAWNGDSTFTFDRIGRGTIDIEAACISIFGTIQPGPLQAILAQAAHAGAADDGLIQRFQLVVWPDTPKTWENNDSPPDPDNRRQAAEVFGRLSDLNLNGQLVQTASGENGVPFLHYTPEAQEMFTEWRTHFELRFLDDSLAPCMANHLAKYRSLIPSLALLIHLADNGCGPVSNVALSKALRWATYLETHAHRLYSSVLSAGPVAATALLQRIHSGVLGTSFALRDVQQKGWSGLNNREAIAEALELLVDLDWLQKTKTPTKGCPRTRYLVSPHAHRSDTR